MDMEKVQEQIAYLSEMVGTRYESAQIELAMMGEEVFSLLTELLDSCNNIVVQQRIIQIFVRSGERAIPTLITCLQSKNARIRTYAAAALGAVKAKSAVPALITLLDDYSHFVRQNAAQTLGILGDRSAEEPLIDHLVKEQNEVVHAVIAEAIDKLQS